MYKLDHPPDPRPIQAVERRRRVDQERMKRIFDPRVRIMGIDVGGLEQQIAIKRELKAIEDERNNTADRVATETNELLQMLDNKIEASRRMAHRDMEAFRRDHQQPHQRRDFDLYDPAALLHDRPAREGDADPRTTVSGLQRFEGEDLEQQERLDAQKRQMQTWVWLKMCENERARRQKQDEDDRREREVMDNNTRIQCMMEAERQHRRQMAVSDAEYNLKLAIEKKLRDAEHRRMETAKNLDEIARQMKGDFLNERPAPPQAPPHALRIDAFKGMTEEQIRDIRETRERQIREAKEREAKQRLDEKAWDRHQFWSARATQLLEREQHRQEREKARQMLQKNQEIATECHRRKSFIDKVVYTNPPTEAYFSQFNTTSR